MGLFPLPAVLQAMEHAWPARTTGAAADGPLELERRTRHQSLFQAWLDAGPQAGFRRTDDVNGFRQEGFAAFDKNVRRGRRLSAARAYLHPVLDRPQPDLDHSCSRQPDRVRGESSGRRRVPAAAAKPKSLAARRSSRAAEPSTRHSCCNSRGVGDPEHLHSLGIPVVSALRRGREHAGSSRGVHPVRLQAAGVDAAPSRQVEDALDRTGVAVPQGPGRHQSFRSRGVRAQATRTSGTPT